MVHFFDSPLYSVCESLGLARRPYALLRRKLDSWTVSPPAVRGPGIDGGAGCGCRPVRLRLVRNRSKAFAGRDTFFRSAAILNFANRFLWAVHKIDIAH